jgi:exonuclease III
VFSFAADAKGQFTYWDQYYVNNRPHNKGVRLDYFLCSEHMFESVAAPSVQTDSAEKSSGAQGPVPLSAASAEERIGELVPVAQLNIDGPNSAVAGPARSSPVRVYDTYILHEDTVGVSDHCPIVLVLSL